MSIHFRLLALSAAIATLAACSTTPRSVPLPKGVDINAIPEPVPRAEPLSRYGNPESYEQSGVRYWVMPNARGFVETGQASWYGQAFDGKRTSSGETYNMYDMTAAHKALPLPTYVRVKALRTGKTVIVRVNDRGPFVKGRVIDLSYAAAAKLGIAEQGTAAVEVRALDPADYQNTTRAATTTAYSAPVVTTPQVVVPVTPAAPVTAMPAQQPEIVSVLKEPEPAPPPETQIYIQVGAYAQENSANSVRVDLLNAQDRDVHVSPISSVMGELHRVRIGPFVSKDEAERLFPLLHKQGYYQSRIIRN